MKRYLTLPHTIKWQYLHSITVMSYILFTVRLSVVTTLIKVVAYNEIHVLNFSSEHSQWTQLFYLSLEIVSTQKDSLFSYRIFIADKERYQKVLISLKLLFLEIKSLSTFSLISSCWKRRRTRNIKSGNTGDNEPLCLLINIDPVKISPWKFRGGCNMV